MPSYASLTVQQELPRLVLIGRSQLLLRLMLKPRTPAVLHDEAMLMCLLLLVAFSGVGVLGQAESSAQVFQNATDSAFNTLAWNTGWFNIDGKRLCDV